MLGLLELLRGDTQISSAQQSVQGRTRPQAFPSAQSHLHPVSSFPFAVFFPGFGPCYSSLKGDYSSILSQFLLKQGLPVP